MVNNPPILKIPMTKWEKLFNAIGVTAFVFSIVYLLIHLGKMADQIPSHFNSKGEVDGWGSKYELFILPFIGFFIFSLITLLEKAPHMYNYPKRLNESNAKQFYLNSRITINFIKNILLIMFSYVLFQSIQIGLNKVNSINFWFIFFLIIVIFVTIILSIYKSCKIK